MQDDVNQLKSNYQELGYFVIRDYFSEGEIITLRNVILKFHQAWKKDNAKFYREEAFNSSLITGSRYLDETDRLILFKFICCSKIMQIVDSIIPTQPAFMNTQLFFNPVNPHLKDFWHRDCQYDHDVEMQKIAIQNTQVLHLRVPLFDELGMELVPGTHKRWDNEEEFNVRQERRGKLSSDSLSTGKQVELAAGDLLVFSADMIHRGLYGMERLAFDILVFDSTANKSEIDFSAKADNFSKTNNYAEITNFVDYVDDDCLPNCSILEQINDPRLLLNTIQLKASQAKK